MDTLKANPLLSAVVIICILAFAWHMYNSQKTTSPDTMSGYKPPTGTSLLGGVSGIPNLFGAYAPKPATVSPTISRPVRAI